MARFNFTTIDLTSKADITEVMNNFNKIESLGITSTEVDTKVATAKSEAIADTNTKLANYTTTANLKPLAKVGYSYGTASPSGGSSGDIYDQYF